jgi:hypothetical protein
MDIFPFAGKTGDQNQTALSPRVLALKEKIDDERYLCEAIQRIALILSNEISEAAAVGSKGDGTHERKG